VTNTILICKPLKNSENQVSGLCFLYFKDYYARCWWLTPIILATKEVENRRIVIQNWPRQTVPRDPISKKLFTGGRNDPNNVCTCELMN
jgi:hypothetical protein